MHFGSVRASFRHGMTMDTSWSAATLSGGGIVERVATAIGATGWLPGRRQAALDLNGRSRRTLMGGRRMSLRLAPSGARQAARFSGIRSGAPHPTGLSSDVPHGPSFINDTHNIPRWPMLLESQYSAQNTSFRTRRPSSPTNYAPTRATKRTSSRWVEGTPPYLHIP